MIKKLEYKHLIRYIKRGEPDKDWYVKCKANIEAVMPGENVDQFIDCLAATSANTSLKGNITQAFKAYRQLKFDKPFQGYTPSVIGQLERVRRGEGLSGRKIRNFADAMKGKKDAIVVDIWIARAFGVNAGHAVGSDHRGGIPKKMYDEIEQWHWDTAPLLGVEPRELCSMIWSGVRTEATGKENTTRYDELLSIKVNGLFDIFSEHHEQKFVT